MVPLLLSLLPGCSLTDIMSCTTAHSVKTLLVEKIQAFKIAASKVSRFVGMHTELAEVYFDYRDVWVLIPSDFMVICVNVGLMLGINF